MPKQSGESQRPSSTDLSFHAERHVPCVKNVARFVFALRVVRPFESDDNAVLPSYKLVRPDPGPILTENPMVGGAHYCSSVLQNKFNAIAHPVVNQSGLTFDCQASCAG